WGAARRGSIPLHRRRKPSPQSVPPVGSGRRGRRAARTSRGPRGPGGSPGRVGASSGEEFPASGLRSFGRLPSWDAVTIATAPTRPDDAGLTIAEIARRRGTDPLDAAGDYVIAERGQSYVLIESIAEEDVRALLRSPAFLVGSDGRAMAPDSVTGRGKPHPRNYGTFPRLLGRYVRELGRLSLEEAVWKITGSAARMLRLTERGLL